ncbi:DEAD/DEAH box helicase [Salmonella enterica]|uniref:DEAD/DEAH box helicase n=6 Tax=Enterobacteriaceae TaxID=543 RepID=A0A483LAL4_KLEPN|nr:MULTISPECIES: DEAD/DEAH box helicase [Enterobacteriaceae]EAA5838239.1 DEAD/DEAH box helicase [Salmonella enterica subsp. enterica serovar Tennessee]EAA8711776.1 DEAD/DEAH box helicase [Salmonella enterica subsp. enterica serovar Derby]EAW1158933.1 DEAD/DEAH box helicase [Salmonella enterica subsp. enterica]EBH8704849.1 DEAD/DEAH box helicase [Salmonella enterica subsp. enterica serovar Newport]EBK1731920.1 DEAD/DEAH box helicase [Salmonella enterica subsp. enterica serovar Heidelberg]EBM77
MSVKINSVPSVSVTYARNGASTKANALGMRPMQERAYEKRGEQYLLIKSPPASGKSRALMFVALDKLANQGIKQAIIVVPEKSIGASFNDEPLSQFGFWADWHVEPKWNLCNAPGNDNGGKVRAFGSFLESSDKVLVCTHATFRFAVDAYGVEAFDDRLIAVDEFHHVSANPDNKLGQHLGQFIARDKTHIVAMTGSYFRGDAEAVLAPQDESRFDTVTYTYYEQLNGYEYLKQLDIGYFFYSGSYVDDILNVLDPDKKTIIHIPNVNSRESTKDKIKEVEHILGALGDWQGADPATGFQLVKCRDGRMLRIADLVDPTSQGKIQESLRAVEMKTDRDYVDIIIALGMAKEGFDWIWCEHALTVGYRASLTEIVQIIGRATRDAPGKTRARFTNLIAEPDAVEGAVTEAVNDTLKAIAASLLMEQVLAPRFEFKPKNPESGPTPGFDYGDGGYDPDSCNFGVNEQTGTYQIEIKGLAEPKSKEAARICQEDLNEVIAAFVQDKPAIERGLFDEELIPEELTQVRMGKIIKEKYPELDAEDQEAVRQHAIAALNLTQQAKRIVNGENDGTLNTALIDGVRRFAMDVRDLDIDLIDRINPFGEAYAILAKTMSEDSLKQVAAAISAKRTSITPEDAKVIAKRAAEFKRERGRLPSLTSADAWEKHLAEGAAAFMRFRAEGRYE